MPKRPHLLFALLAVLLVACSEATLPDVGLRQAEVSTYARENSPPVLALALGVGDAARFSTAGGVPRQDLVEIAPDLFVGPVAGATDRATTIDLPAAADLPDDAIVLLEQALLNLDTPACAPVSVPGDAMATVSTFDAFALPGLIALTAEGAFLTVATDGPVPAGIALEEFAGTFYGWLHVDRDATLATGGACAQFDVELELAEGWNQIGWTSKDGGVLIARVVEPAPVQVFALVAMPVTFE